MKRIVILGANARDGEQWRKDHGLSRSAARYYGSALSMLGLRDVEIAFTSGAHLHRDYAAMRGEAYRMVATGFATWYEERDA